MKIKAIAKLCKDTRQIIIMDDDQGDVQWISNGVGIYPLWGMPELDPDTVCIILDIPEEERAKYKITRQGMPKNLCFRDHDDTERLVLNNLLTIGFGGEELMPARTSLGLWFYNQSLLRPLSDIKKPVEIYERETSDGQVYLACKTGVLLQSVILPKLPYPEQLLDHLETLARELRTSITRRNMEDKEKAEGEAAVYYGTLLPEADQPALPPAADPDTGEVL